MSFSVHVIPAKAGIQCHWFFWIPACAGMTNREDFCYAVINDNYSYPKGLTSSIEEGNLSIAKN
jgi:hypothetical protein